MKELCKKKIFNLAIELSKCCSEIEKIELLEKNFVGEIDPRWRSNLVALSLMTIGQAHLLPCDEKHFRAIERYYAPIGGLVGYHSKVLSLMEHELGRTFTKISKAPGPDLRQNSFVDEGLEALEHMGEIYPIGGLGSRLNFCSEDGSPLPAALLPFGGRTLLEGLIRDVEGREHLFYKKYGRQITVPIGMMSSEENQKHLIALLEKKKWFGRPKESFFIFAQLSVPVVTLDGVWTEQMDPNGHGALWGSALNSHLFDWFGAQDVKHLLIRQINNPIGGVDHSLLSFVGYGAKENKTFGFASCDRLKGAAEGVLVLVDDQTVSNIEYTDLCSKALSDHFPANTNILYVNLEKILPIIRENPLPGLMVNLKGGNQGRLESMMQSISDQIAAEQAYITYNSRRKTISSTKRKFTGELLETPEGAFFDQMHNAHELLQSCGTKLPEIRDEKLFLEKGPAVLFTYAPKLGPTYAEIQQKIIGGDIEVNSELVCELADLHLEALTLSGSLVIEVEQCHLTRVCVKNRGKSFCAWDGTVVREESLIIRGKGTFIAEDVEISGNQIFDIPEGECWLLTPSGLEKNSVLV